LRVSRAAGSYISEIITEPGVEVVGPLPREISTPTALVGFLSARSKEPEVAKALLRHLFSPEAAAVYKERGMQPGALRGPPSHSGATHKGDARLHVIPLFISHCS